MEQNRPHIIPGVYVDWVEEVYGWGVFTKERIEKHTIVEASPVIIYPEEIIKIASWNAKEDRGSNESLGLTLYSLRWGDGYAAIPMGYGGVYNHSDRNNCQFVDDLANGILYIVSLRDIEPGEQLLVSYGEDWFDNKPFPKIDL